MQTTVIITERELDALREAVSIAFTGRRATKSTQAWVADAHPFLQRAEERMGEVLRIEAAKPAKQRLAEAIFGTAHTKDSDCMVGEDGLCTVCGVDHSVTCPVCSGRGFHADGCVRI